MQPKLILALAAVLAARLVGAKSAQCSDSQYDKIPSVSSSSYTAGRKAPPGAYSTLDLGKTKTEDDARQRCQQKCSSSRSGTCASVIVEFTKLPTCIEAKCFLYKRGDIPRQAGKCSSQSKKKLWAYVRDETNKCFASSPKYATKFCSSYLHIPLKTKTSTLIPPKKTVTAIRTVTATVSVTATLSRTATQTAVITNTETSTISTSTSTSTLVLTEADTETETSTATVTQTVDYSGPVKRSIDSQKAAAVPRAVQGLPCISAGTPSSRISAACLCLSIQPATTTRTTTLKAATTTVTRTSTATRTKTLSTTTTAATVTATITETSVSEVVASTETITTSISITTTTITEIATATETISCPASSPKFCANSGSCRNVMSNEQNNCGACGETCANSEYCNRGVCTRRRYSACSSFDFCGGSTGCVCYGTKEGGRACAVNGGLCGQACDSSADCPGNHVCLTECGHGGCTNAGDDTCANSVAPGRLFRAKARMVGASGDNQVSDYMNGETRRLLSAEGVLIK